MTAIPDRLAAALADRYRLERELGAGGMATVYLAQDLRHDRQVAIKVLRPELAAVLGADRFVQEIKTTAALQHPHILPLFDSGQADGFLFYVMPYVEGETLRAKLDREKQLGIEEAVKITTEVADALDYAHRHGVIHRDIKPENTLLHDGRPMVADFGIALAVSAAAGGRMTETGLSLGTPHYMSPEQATAEKDITARSDVYSLASVLYEMLAGEPPHTGGTAQQIIMKIIAEPVAEVTSLRKSVPANVAAAVGKALEKLPADRFESAKAFADALADLHFTLGSGAAGERATVPSARHRRRVLSLGAALTLMAALATWGWLRPAHLALPVRLYVMSLDVVGADDLEGANQRLAISPGGRDLAVIREFDDSVRVWLQPRDALDATPISGTDGAGAVTFSPDGLRIAFLARSAGIGERLEVADLNGAPPTLIADSGLGVDGVSWSDDGFLYVDGLTGSGTTGLVRVRLDGRARQIVTTVDTAHGETDHVWPDALPGGRGVIFTVRRRSGPAVAVLDTRTGKTRLLLDGANAVYVSPGYLIYTAGLTRLMAVPFDAKRLELTGMGVQLATVHPSVRGGAEVAASASGTVMYVSGGGSLAAGEPVWVDQHGRISAVDVSLPSTVTGVALSPDGKRLAMTTTVTATPEQRLAYQDLQGGPVTRLPVPGARASYPRWSPDGRWIYYLSDPHAIGGIHELWRVATDGGNGAERVSAFDDFIQVDLRSNWLVAMRRASRANGSDRVIARRLEGDTAFADLVTLRARAEDPQLSPDGRWLAYTSMESGTAGMHVRPFPHADSANWLVAADLRPTTPLWSPDGRTLYYVTSTDSVVALSLRLESSVQVEARHTLFDASPFRIGSGTWAITNDGPRFLMIRASGAHEASRLVVIENAPAYLERQFNRSASLTR